MKRARFLLPPWLGAAFPAAALVGLIVLWAPQGYMGGGSDDWHYLQAARCAATNGFCLPPDHWWTRYPLVIPLGRALDWIGESRAVLVAVAALYSVIAAVCFAELMRRHFGSVAAIVGTLLLFVTPEIATNVARIGVDLPELACALMALLVIDEALRRGSQAMMLLGGVIFGIAIAMRTTSIILVPPALLLVAMGSRGNKTLILALGTGMVAAPLAEMAAYAMMGADPLTSWARALSHTRIPSTELSAAVDTRQSPILNPDYIDGWQRASGVRLHWTVDPLVNLIVHPAIGLTIIAGALLVFIHRHALDRRWIVGLTMFGGYYFLAIAYGLAIDPKPRMFLPVAAVAAALGGIAVARGWNTALRWPGIAVVVLLCAHGLIEAGRVRDMSVAEALADQWVGADAGTTAIDPTTRRALAFSTAVAQAPADIAAPRAQLLLAQGKCPAMAHDLPLNRQQAVPPLGAGRWVAAAGFAPAPLTLCWFARL